MSDARQKARQRAPRQLAGMTGRVKHMGVLLDGYANEAVDTELNKLYAAVGAVLRGRGTEDVPKAKERSDINDDLAAIQKAHKEREERKAAEKAERKRKAEANKPKREAQKAREQILWAKQYDDAKGYLDIRKGDAVVKAAVIKHTIGPHPLAGLKGLKDQERFVLIASIGGAWTRVYMNFSVFDNGDVNQGETKPAGWTFVVARRGVIDPDLPRSVKELKKILHNNHPDTNPDADNGLYIRATTQLDLIRKERRASRASRAA